MRYGSREIRTGMTAYGSDGEKLGKVIEVGGNDFVVEKGFFSPKDYLLPYSCIDRVEGDGLHLNLTRTQISEGRWNENLAGTTAAGATAGTDWGKRAGGKDEIRVPVSEEQVDVIKERREAGNVQIRKDVVTEEKHFTVPVTREDVRVERVPASRATQAGASDASFKKETINVPIHEEEVEIRKRPVVREEIRVSKERHTEEQPVNETIRREEVDVDRSNERIRTGEKDDKYKF